MAEGLVSKWSVLQKLKEKKGEKKLNVGIGFSASDNSYTAAREAADKALKELGGKEPTISFIYYAGNYDPTELSKGLKETLKDSEFVGGSTDRVFYNQEIIDHGILIASLQSDFLHVGVASNDNASKDPYEVAKKTVVEAVKKLTIDEYIDPYLQVSRMKKGEIKWMIKIPSFFVMVYARGMKLPVMGDETKIINGIFDILGPNVPLYGASYGTTLENLFGGKPYEIYLLHNGKVLKDGVAMIVASSSLIYGQSLEHGCKRTDKLGFISKASGNGYVVNEISGKNAIDWYCEQLKMKKDEFIKQSMVITQRWPLGIPDGYGSYIIRGAGVHNNGSLAYVAPLIEGWPVYLMDAEPKNLMGASNYVSMKIKEYTGEKGKPAIIFANLCASRRAIFKEKLTEELKLLQEKFGGAPLVGFSCFGEIGSAPGKPAGFQHMSANIFVLFDKLLTELK